MCISQSTSSRVGSMNIMSSVYFNGLHKPQDLKPIKLLWDVVIEELHSMNICSNYVIQSSQYGPES